LILIGEGQQGPEIMFVERAAACVPTLDRLPFLAAPLTPGDHDIAETALREAAEETGVDRSGIEVLGLLPPRTWKSAGSMSRR
jgi:8-oxo-dGTP pyrophosphatase MutT (NUDIX family)